MSKPRYGSNKKKRIARVVRSIQARIDIKRNTAADDATLKSIKAGSY